MNPGAAALLFLILVAVPLRGDSREGLFLQGNRLYEAGDYRKALESYAAIAAMGYESGPLYFNLGNCYYKLNETGQAILHYERAARLIPGDEDLEVNLSLARLKVVDRIPELPRFRPLVLLERLVFYFPLNVSLDPDVEFLCRPDGGLDPQASVEPRPAVLRQGHLGRISPGDPFLLVPGRPDTPGAGVLRGHYPEQGGQGRERSGRRGHPGLHAPRGDQGTNSGGFGIMGRSLAGRRKRRVAQGRLHGQDCPTMTLLNLKSAVWALIAAFLMPGAVSGALRQQEKPIHLIEAAERGDVNTVKYLLDLGVDVNGRDEQGTTALTAAAWEGQTEVVKMLLERGSEIDPQDDLAGMTPLIWACWKGYGDTVGVLVEAGADVNIKDKNDRGGLMGAAWEGRTQIIGMLVAAGAQLEARDYTGATALMWAAWNGRLESTKALLAAGAAIDARENEGKTALIGAATDGHLPVVRALVNAGAQLDIKDQKGLTALSAAASNRHTEVVRYLQEAGAQ